MPKPVKTSSLRNLPTVDEAGDSDTSKHVEGHIVECNCIPKKEDIFKRTDDAFLSEYLDNLYSYQDNNESQTN